VGQGTTPGEPCRHVSTNQCKYGAIYNTTNYERHRRGLMRWLPRDLKKTECRQSEDQVKPTITETMDLPIFMTQVSISWLHGA